MSSAFFDRYQCLFARFTLQSDTNSPSEAGKPNYVAKLHKISCK
ncbi:hypothetical protein HMPREF9098_0535 [Kingella denitrificans ATCC 33394]|uniref:Uncharacterized protein n=1 Tax=Kingella denitrificans ATCC 33394 TaxID=888741 RepID=F0EXF1_9NEIS|nr:hypothetical protein HMPREF9098_0535 [Kingella denitrificans ATCC 33394]